MAKNAGIFVQNIADFLGDDDQNSLEIDPKSRLVYKVIGVYNMVKLNAAVYWSPNQLSQDSAKKLMIKEKAFTERNMWKTIICMLKIISCVWKTENVINSDKSCDYKKLDLPSLLRILSSKSEPEFGPVCTVNNFFS